MNPNPTSSPISSPDTHPTLDPHPRNLLGKGVLDPDLEAQLLAEGVVCAWHVISEGKMILGTSEIPRMQAAALVIRSAWESEIGERKRHYPKPGSPLGPRPAPSAGSPLGPVATPA